MAAGISLRAQPQLLHQRRAASISASVTRPSDFATCPINSNVVRKNTSEIERRTASARPGARHAERALVEEVADERPDDGPPNVAGDEQSDECPENLPFQAIRVDLSHPPPPQSPAF